MDKKILAIYVNINEVHDVDSHVRGVHDMFLENKDLSDYYIITIPTLEATRIECIDPQYITDNELIEKNNKLMMEMKIMLENKLSDNE